VRGFSPDSLVRLAVSRMGAMGLLYGVYILKCFYSLICCVAAMTVCNVSLSFCICISCMCCLLA